MAVRSRPVPGRRRGHRSLTGAPGSVPGRARGRVECGFSSGRGAACAGRAGAGKCGIRGRGCGSPERGRRAIAHRPRWVRPGGPTTAQMLAQSVNRVLPVSFSATLRNIRRRSASGIGVARCGLAGRSFGVGSGLVAIVASWVWANDRGRVGPDRAVPGEARIEDPITPICPGAGHNRAILRGLVELPAQYLPVDGRDRLDIFPWPAMRGGLSCSCKADPSR